MIKKLIKYLFALVAGLLMTSLTACDDHFFEYEGDCEVHHIIRFVYDMNLKWADAFPSEVKSVNLYVFDNNGIFVKEYIGAGDELSKPGYGIELDLPVGSYKFLAWCGIENEGASEESFTVTQPMAGVTTLNDVVCSLNTQKTGVYSGAKEGADYSGKRLYFLYWGYIEETLTDNHDGTTYEYIISLYKDTNHLRIILQELNGEDMDPKDYQFDIVDANGVMSWDNNLIGNNPVIYQPWSQVNDEVGVGRIDTTDGSIKYVKGIVADLSLARLLASQRNNVFLTITNSSTGEVIAKVPVIQYALLAREYYEKAYGHLMTDQELLDREDEYVMTFFLVNGKWLDSYIDILQWRIVLHDYEIGS